MALVTDQRDCLPYTDFRVCYLIRNSDSQIRGRPAQEGLSKPLQRSFVQNKPLFPLSDSLHIMMEISDGSVVVYM